MKFEDRFSNIDDKTAERLSQKYPFLDEERKARLYTMSKRKSDRNNVPETNNIEVSGVDKYHRPMWYRSVSIAAAAVLVVAGIGGSTFLISRNGKDKAPAASVSEESTAAVTEAVTGEAAEEATIAVEEGTVAAAEEVDPDAVAKELVDAYTEYLGALFGGTMEVDKTKIVTKNYPEMTREYYLVTDKRYPNWEAVEKRCYEIFDTEFAKDLLKNWEYSKEEDATYNVFMYSTTDGSLYTEKDVHDNLNAIKWDQNEIKATLTPEGNITCELTFTTFDNNTIKTSFTIVKTENGWRISKADESLLTVPYEDPDVVAKVFTDSYNKFFLTFYTGDLKYDKSDVITRNMVSSEDGSNVTIDYYRVTDPRLPAGYDLKEECFSIFDDELANSIYENLCCDEDNVTDKALIMKRKDGSYYVMNCWYYEGDKVDKWDQDTVKGTLNPDGTITTVLTKTHNDPAFRKSEYNFTFVKTENGWRISKVDYVEYDEAGNPIEYPVDEGTKEWNNKITIEIPTQEQTSEQNNKVTIEIPEEATAASNN